MNLSLETAGGTVHLKAFVPPTMRSQNAVRRRGKAGFATHRQPLAERLVDAVAARYPVVCRLAGAESFRAVAHRFVLARRPRSPALARHAETFPDFIRSLGRMASIDYLADVAELEMLCGRAYRAADAAATARSTFASLPPERLADLRVALHPSVALLASRFPVVTVWEANRDDSDAFPIRHWVAERALIARPFRKVEVRRLSAGGLAFLAALQAGTTLRDAAQAATAAGSEFQLAARLAQLIELNILVGFRSSGGGGLQPNASAKRSNMLPQSALERSAVGR